MNANSQLGLFNILYALVALNGREAALFGTSFPRACDALAHSAACDTFPEVWFELPLAGEPWFDVHFLASKESLDPSADFAADVTGGYPDVFAWFAQQEGVRQLALSWDVGVGDATTPAVQVLVAGRDPEVSCAFLRAAKRDDLQDAYRTFIARMPASWFACYTGTFPNREKDFVRVECIVDDELQKAYAQDASLLEAHLRQAGIDALGDTAVARCQELAQSPFQTEFQFNVTPDGNLAPTFSASARFPSPATYADDPSCDLQAAQDALMQHAQDWGLADERWRLLADTVFAKRVARGEDSNVLFNYPAFLKLRWHEGEPVDAKTYLLAGIQTVNAESGD